MKTILCYGDSNTWGNIAGSRNKELMLAKRYGHDVRWTGVLQKILGAQFHIVEAGLNGRNTSFNETRFNRPSRNGLATLPLILETHYPLDLVILMLGTNDTLIDFNASPEQTVKALQQMIEYIRTCHLGPEFTAPQILLIAPAPITKIDSVDFNLFFNEESVVKTKILAPLLQKLATEKNCAFIDAGAIATVSPQDGVHLNRESHTQLAKVIAEKIKSLNL